MLFGGRKLSLSRFVASVAAVSAIAIGGAEARAALQNTRPFGPLGDADLQNMFSRSPSDIPAGIYVGGPVYDAVLDQSPQAVFTNSASAGSIATYVLELSSASDTNVFGLYDYADPNKKVRLFDGANGPGDQTLVSFMADGRVLVFFVDSGVTNFSGRFGFFTEVYSAPLGAGGDGNPTTLDITYYTEDSLNLGGQPQALVYQGNNATSIALPGFASGIFSSGEWLIAFEDGATVSGQSNRDFSDLVVLMESLTPLETQPVPAVSTWGLVILGLLFLALAKARAAARRLA